jgi:penicillin amidase
MRPSRRSRSAVPVARPLGATAFSLILTALALVAGALPAAAQPVHLPALDGEARVVTDSLGIPHACASSERDVMVLLGWLHARDRLFQMDFSRRLFSGTLAELLGAGAIFSDVQLRTLGLRRAAEATWTGYQALAGTTGSNAAELLTGYAAGVNAWIERNPPPPEYGALELTAVELWNEVDSLVMAKGLAFGLSFELGDIDRTLALLAYAQAGAVQGFSGPALFAEDVFRSAPFDGRVSIPGALPATAAAPVRATGTAEPAAALAAVDPRIAELARAYRDAAAAVPLLARAFDRKAAGAGSNWWIVSGERTASGFPVLANDPHLGLDTPAVFYEAHLLVSPAAGCGLPAGGLRLTPGAAAAPRAAAAPGTSPGSESLNVNGVTFAGVPGVVQGCNRRICWGSTTNPMDVTDVYQERLVVDGGTGLPVATLFDGQPEPLVLIPQIFRANLASNGVPDSSAAVPVGPLEGGVTLIVPRRNHGPIVQVDASVSPPIALSIQYTGWRDTYELEAFLRWMRAADLDDFTAGLQYFDVGSQNWAYADVDGTIAYFTSGEMPLREDLQNLNFPDGGVPPYLIRDGTGTLAHEWLPATPGGTHANPYQVLPFAEMPQAVDPAAGWLANANNDPIGTTLDNDPLNQLRPGGGLLYLSPGYSSLRMGRIARELEALLAGGHQATDEELAAIQANNELLDAELILPFLSAAFDGAVDPEAPPELVALGTDPEIIEAIARLRGWDFSTPTGIEEGWDPGDDPDDLPAPSAAEIANSVAATIWAVWRGQAIRTVVDATLAGIGLGDFQPGGSQAYIALEHLLATFEENQGIGASGVDFFPAAEGVARGHARDLALLGALRDALDLLAGSAFHAAFGGSTDQGDYRWGRLHRITFEHPIEGPFEIPPAGGFTDLAPLLPGIARAGGYEAVDASSHSARASSDFAFEFSSGPARRFVGILDPAGIDARQVIPGGQSGVPGSPHYADQLPLWLTNRYHELVIEPGAISDVEAVEEFTPVGQPCVPDDTTLCFLDDRFRVTVDWRTSFGTTGPGRVVPVGGSARSGLFWFFAPDNWEMLVKVLDGCAVNDRFWVFAASATNVEWTLRVEDTAAGELTSYTHPLGPASPAVTDTAAFATCP